MRGAFKVWIDDNRNFPKLSDFLEVYRSEFAPKDDDGPNYDNDEPEFELTP